MIYVQMGPLFSTICFYYVGLAILPAVGGCPQPIEMLLDVRHRPSLLYYTVAGFSV